MKTLCGMDGLEENYGSLTKEGQTLEENIPADGDKRGVPEDLDELKPQAIREFNALGIPDMPEVTELGELDGSYVNLEYCLPSGQKVKLLDDDSVYLGNQLEKPSGDRCYGLVADNDHLLVCEYGCIGSDPEIIVFKKR